MTDAVEVNVNKTPEKAQLAGKPHPPKEHTKVHEVHVRADRVITDTSDPLAVQVPRKEDVDGLTPISLAYENAVTPEQAFSSETAADDQ